MSMAVVAQRFRVEGLVQGVGFRPYVWRLAQRHGVRGWVRNHGGSVEILVEGDGRALERFRQGLVADAPPLARIDRVDVAVAEPPGAAGFEVDRSVSAGGTAATARRLVSPDAATCRDCLAELHHPDDRRHRYPFVNCTNCGPRFTIINALPYDRAQTSMARFELCADCAREYGDPGDRRFHAEPVACPACGPQLVLVDASGRPLAGEPTERATALLGEGRIMALKGLGGYQFGCDATDERVVAELRRRKQRPHKPLAVMVADLDTAATLADIGASEASLLTSPQGPIVLVRQKPPGRESAVRLAPSVAPGHRRIGLMLPTSPLHHLLLTGVGRPLVMTSGNRSDEPIATNDVDACRRLGDIADAFLTHDRPIVARYDDSVAVIRRGVPAVLRRARGIAPAPVGLPVGVEPVLGVGADLQAAFCLATGTDAYLSPHIGDLDTDDALAAYREALSHYRRLLGIEPSVVAHDLHPDLLSTRLAESLGLPRVPVQHHHAHIVSVMAEHGLSGPGLGVAFDGFGLGADGTAWGGEFLVCDWARAERLGHLRTVSQPGSDAAVHYPARMALAHARDAGRFDAALGLLGLSPKRPADLLGGATPELVAAQIDAQLASPLTSSVGRLFDAVAALTGVCRDASYEGQPAMLLEQAAGHGEQHVYPVAVTGDADRLVVDTRPLIAGVVDDVSRGVDSGTVAARFHIWLAEAVAEVTAMLAARLGLRTVCAGGGVWANDALLVAVDARLAARGLELHIPRAVPPGDGGLALGQVLVAHARHVQEGS
jgi:hydrogenase maturation protein HypF